MPIIKTLKNGAWTPVNSVSTISTATSSVNGLMSSTDKTKLDAVADYIVEQGTSGIWTYRKWNSGIAECWGKTTVTGTSWTAWGSCYELLGGTSYWVYPTNLFTQIDSFNVNPFGDNSGSWCETYNNGTNIRTPSCYAIRPNTASTLSITISFFVLGRWK